MVVKFKAVTTVEVALIMPVILLVLSGVIISVFYYHDKNVLYSHVHQLGSVIHQENRKSSGADVDELKLHLEQIVEGKLLLFDGVESSVEEVGQYITITASVQKNSRAIKISKSYQKVYPEQVIRKLDLFD